VDAKETVREREALHHVLEGQNVGGLGYETVGVGIFGPITGDPWRDVPLEAARVVCEQGNGDVFRLSKSRVEWAHVDYEAE